MFTCAAHFERRLTAVLSLGWVEWLLTSRMRLPSPLRRCRLLLLQALYPRLRRQLLAAIRKFTCSTQLALG